MDQIAMLCAALVGAAFLLNKMYQSFKEDKASGSISEEAENLVSSLSTQYQMISAANKELTTELITLRKNNIKLSSETSSLKTTINELKSENIKLVKQIESLQHEITELKNTLRQLINNQISD